jgi:AcrR family transcriptional regulator
MSKFKPARLTSAETRSRLLLAGAELFAARGFRATTIRALAQKARTNIAAVHYHFGGKEDLYREVLKDSLSRAFRKYPPTLDLPENPSPENRLHSFVRSFFFRLLDDSPDAHHGQLMAREMASPTSALDEIVDTVLKPMSDTLNAILRDLLGPAATPPLVTACAASVVAQVLFYRHSRPVVERLNPALAFARPDLERLADHVTRFSLAALHAIAQEARQ